MFFKKNLSPFKLGFCLLYSVWKKDGFIGVMDHGKFFLKIRFQKIFQKKEFSPREIVFLSECPGASMRYRCNHVVEQLQKIKSPSCAFEINEVDFQSCIKAHKIIILHRVLHTDEREKIIKKFQEKGKIFIFDTDDLIFNLNKIDSIKKLPEVQFNFLKKEFKRLQKTLKICDYAIGSTTKMKIELERYVPQKCFFHSNMISDWEFKNAQKYKNKKKDLNQIILGYASGTRTHDDDFLEIEEAVLKILKKYPQTKLRIIGLLNLSKKFKTVSAQIEKKKLVTWEKLPKELSQFDINLAPLEKIELNEAKSDLKFFEAACVGIPTVATDIGAFHENIENDITGLLAKNETDFFQAIERLILDSEKRIEIGKKAFDYVQKERTSEKGAQNLKQILDKIRLFDSSLF